MVAGLPSVEHLGGLGPSLPSYFPIHFSMTNQKKIACALVRVSSEEQARGGYGLEFQERDIRTFCDRNNLELIRVFRDEGYSGSTAERPGLQEGLQWARAKRFQVLVVWKLDRLFRDTKLTLQTVDELAALGVEVSSVQESFTHDSNGRFLLTIFAAGAEKERRDIAIRMHSGRVAAARKGTWVVGGVPFGYRYDAREKCLTIDKDEARIVRKLFQWLVREKLSLYKLQNRLNENSVPTKFDRLGRKTPSGSTHWWAKRTIGRILTNQIYTGTRTLTRRPSSGLVHDTSLIDENATTIIAPVVISPSLFEKAQAQLRENSLRSPRRTKELYLLRGLLVCGRDSRRMQGARQADGRSQCKYYFCPGTRKAFAPVRCPSRSISESRLVPPVWDKLKELLCDPATVLKDLQRYRVDTIGPSDGRLEIRSLQERREKLLARRTRLGEVYVSGSIGKDLFHTETLKLRLAIDEVDSDLALKKSKLMTDRDIAERALNLQKLYERYRTKLSEASDEAKREILSLFVRSIKVDGKDLHIQVSLPEPDTFAGQSSQRLSRKLEIPIVLSARLLSQSEIWKQKGLVRNLGRWGIKRAK